ncbi:CoA ester lyase [Lentibacillus sp. N15]|uniref:HpcH/HpaI aldolase/citrate lyase family protein n=1 Tax=Lentibacillus songyuanensis TaxID=3136161 RepID=UPI0031BA1063
MTLLQTLLFAPANHPRKVQKALNLEVDAIIIDLEDACAIEEKEKSRPSVVKALQLPRTPKAYVRVNPISTPYFFGDINAVVIPNLDGIILPKVETAEDLTIADWIISSLEKELNLPYQSIDVIPIIETAKGVSNLKSILKNKKRVNRIAFGAGDFTNDLGIEWNKSSNELLYTKSKIVIESRTAKLDPPIDTVYVDLGDQEGLKEETEAAKKLGFQGKLLIHPQQIEIVKTIINPGEDEIKKAEEIIEAFEEAEKNGSSSIRVGDQFVDYPVVYNARKILSLAKNK